MIRVNDGIPVDSGQYADFRSRPRRAGVSRDARIYPDKNFPAMETMGHPVVRLDNGKLGGIQGKDDLGNAKFNGCLFRWGKKNLLCYRAYSKMLDGRGNIFVSELDDKYQIVRNVELDLPEYGSMRQYEDARFFEHNGGLYISYVVVDYKTKWWSGIQVSRLDDDLRVTAHYCTDYDGNCSSRTQKNWLHFSQGGELYMVYDVARGVTVRLDDEHKVVEEYRGRDLFTHWGELRGGTTPVEYDGAWLSFAHSSIPHRTRKRRYCYTPYLFSKEPPFDIVKIGKPTWASLQNPVVDASATWWHPIVLFPAGQIVTKKTIDVSMGVNDLYTAIQRIPRNKLELFDTDDYHEFRPRFYRFRRMQKYPGDYRILKAGGGANGIIGVIRAETPADIAEVESVNWSDVEVITEDEYNGLVEKYTR